MDKRNRAFTLIEMVVAITIIGVVALTFMSTFSNISKSLFFSKSKMLASNLAQEKMQIIKQKSYYMILVTSSPLYMTDITPQVPYDPGYFSPESIFEGGISFQRYTYIQVVNEVNGKMEIQPPGTPDSGIKLITISVTWYEGSNKRILQLRSDVSNPDMNTYNAVIKGRVRNAVTGDYIPDATVLIAENVGWQSRSDSAGYYSISFMAGTYDFVASANGYFTLPVQITVNPGDTLTNDFDLSPMSSGTITGDVWIADHIVISQVVGSLLTADAIPFDQEYVELFNPTTFTWQVAAVDVTGTTNPVTGIKFENYDNDISSATMDFNVLSIPSKNYYLIANTATITAGGVTRAADAVYREGDNFIKCFEGDGEGKGGVGIYKISDGSWLDRLGWRGSKGGTKKSPLSIYEGNPLEQNIGLQRDEQFIRLSYAFGGNVYFAPIPPLPTSIPSSNPYGIIDGWGRAYDSGNNDGYFISAGNYYEKGDFRNVQPVFYKPKNSSVHENILAATPVYGAIITATDNLSASAATVCSTNTAGATNPPKGTFRLLSVSTGTWSVMMSYYSAGSNCLYTSEITSVTVTANATTGVPNTLTSPKSPAAGYYSAFLNNTDEQGYITGRVTNANGSVISPSIKVSANPSSAEPVTVNTYGNYSIKIDSGIYTVTANDGLLNPDYVSQTLDSIVVEAGRVTSGINFLLPQGGSISGFVTRDASNPIPNVAISALDANGIERGQGISGNDGHFYIVNLTTTTYDIQPVLGSKETSIPSKYTVTVDAGSSIFVGTFTISGIMGKITGAVTASSKKIGNGILILATADTLAAPDYLPPVLSSATLTGIPLFVTSSYENGTYSLEVMGSTVTKYNLYGYYTTYSGETPATTPQHVGNIQVLPGNTITGVNLAW